MKLYHVTELKNLKSITKQGLKLGDNKKLFFAESFSGALAWCNILGFTNMKAVILSVNLPKNKINIRYLFPQEKDVYNIKEIIYNSNISAHKIAIVKILKRG